MVALCDHNNITHIAGFLKAWAAIVLEHAAFNAFKMLLKNSFVDSRQYIYIF